MKSLGKDVMPISKRHRDNKPQEAQLVSPKGIYAFVLPISMVGHTVEKPMFPLRQVNLINFRQMK